jgi:hypothetical protein
MRCCSAAVEEKRSRLGAGGEMLNGHWEMPNVKVQMPNDKSERLRLRLRLRLRRYSKQ